MIDSRALTSAGSSLHHGLGHTVGLGQQAEHLGTNERAHRWIAANAKDVSKITSNSQSESVLVDHNYLWASH